MFWVGLSAAFAAGPDVPPSYTDMPSATSLRNLKKIGARDPAALGEAEKIEWVRARFAWVGLLRLQGKGDEALRVFDGCGLTCENWGPAAEWAALKKWGCARNKDAAPCGK